jgi:hypothetical protein
LIHADQDTVNEHCLTDTGMSAEKDLRSMLKKRLDNVSVSSGVNGWYVDLVKVVGVWLPVGLESLLPWSPVPLLWVQEVLEHGEGVWEH